MNLNQIASRVAARVLVDGGGAMAATISSIVSVPPDEEGALAFHVQGTCNGISFDLVFALSIEEGGAWDVVSGEMPYDGDADVAEAVFSHPVVHKAIEDALG